jgi:hypothetical protein
MTANTIEDALLVVHAGKRALQMARTMRDHSLDRLGLHDDIVEASISPGFRRGF